MAITFPRAMPVMGPASEHFEIQRFDAVSPQAGGRVSAVALGFPLWEARWSLSGKLSREQSEGWRAWVASLRGPLRTFYGRDYGRPYPLSAPNGFAGMTRAGGGAFAGAATSWSVNTDRDVLSLSGLPAAFRLSIGDYVMLRWSGGERRSLHRMLEPATASGAGVATVTVEPPVPTLVPGSAVADLAQPSCVMRLVPSETRIGEKTRTLRVDGTIVALQDLRP